MKLTPEENPEISRETFADTYNSVSRAQAKDILAKFTPKVRAEFNRHLPAFLAEVGNIFPPKARSLKASTVHDRLNDLWAGKPGGVVRRAFIEAYKKNLPGVQVYEQALDRHNDKKLIERLSNEVRHLRAKNEALERQNEELSLRQVRLVDPLLARAG